MMSRSIFVAFAGLIALTAVAAQLLEMEGASTMTKLINSQIFKDAVSPITVTYPGSGTGAGRAWVNDPAADFNGHVAAFGDGVYNPLPDKIAEIPIAFGSIALYVNLPGFKGNLCISVRNQCKLFDAPKGFTKWSDIIPSGLPATLANLPVRVVVRSDSSGSTNAVKAYYNLICPAYVQPATFTFAIDTSTSPPTIAQGWVGADNTAGVVAAISQVVGSVGYAGCGQIRTANLIEMPLSNLLGTCTVCRNCPVVATLPGYSAAIKCGNYAKFKVALPAGKCDWTGIQVNGDKDNDGDIYGVDTDNDGDGIGKSDFPIVFAEYAYFNRLNREPACQLAKAVLKKLIGAAFQPNYDNFGFYTLPLDVRKTGCACLKQLCGGIPTTATGIINAAGVCS